MADRRAARPELLAFAARLKNARLIRGQSQGQAARMIGISDACLQRAETAKTVPIHRKLQAIAKAYGISEAEIYELAGRLASNQAVSKSREISAHENRPLDPITAGACIRRARLGLPNHPAAYLCARSARVATTTWTLLEAGFRLPRPAVLDRIAMAVNLEPGKLRILAGYDELPAVPALVPISLGQMIREARHKKGWSATLCGYRARVATETLQALEKDNRDVSREVLGRLSDVLDIDRDEVLRLAGYDPGDPGDAWAGVAERAVHGASQPVTVLGTADPRPESPPRRNQGSRRMAARGSWEPPWPLRGEWRP